MELFLPLLEERHRFLNLALHIFLAVHLRQVYGGVPERCGYLVVVLELACIGLPDLDAFQLLGARQLLLSRCHGSPFAMWGPSGPAGETGPPPPPCSVGAD